MTTDKDLLAMCDQVLKAYLPDPYDERETGDACVTSLAIELKRRIEQPSEREKELIGAAQEFVAKAERGEARSKLSYARFKVALAAYDKGEKE